MGYQSLYESIKSKIYEADEMFDGAEPEIEEEAVPEITPALTDELAEPLGIEDKEQFQLGLQEEIKLYSVVNKDLNIIAGIVAEKLKELPNFYTLLQHMKENAAKETEEVETGEEEPIAEEPVEEPIADGEVVTEESVAPIDSKPAAATAITSEAKKKDVKKEDKKKDDKKVKEGKVDYNSINTGDTEANLKALTEKLALAEKKINELNSLIANKGTDIQKPVLKPKVEQALAKGSEEKEVVAGAEAGKGAQVVANKDGKELEKEANIEKLGDKVAPKVVEPLKKKLGGQGYTPKY